MEVNNNNIQYRIISSPDLEQEFSDIKFDGDVDIVITKSRKKLRFSNCTFNQLTFNFLKEHSSLEFSNCEFKEDLNINIQAKDCEIIFDATLYNTFLGNFFVTANESLATLFLKNQAFIDNEIEIHGRIDSLTFSKYNKITGPIKSITLFGCSIREASFSFLKLESLTIDNSMINSFRINSVVSTGYIQILSNQMRTIRFTKSLFAHIIFIGQNTIADDFIFQDLDFTAIQNSKFSIEVNNTKFSGRTRFINIKSPTVLFSHCNFLSPLYFDLIDSPNFILHSSSIESDVFITDVKFGDSSVETFTILKSKFISQNDRINELVYRKKEFQALLGVCWRKRKISDVVILFFSKISNNYGTRWDWGIVFTLIVSLLFYFLYIIVLAEQAPFNFGYTDWQSFVRASKIGSTYYFKFLDITHDTNFITQQPISFLANLVDFLGRIFIAFGFYQTIQAFRKFGKDNQ